MAKVAIPAKRESELKTEEKRDENVNDPHSPYGTRKLLPLTAVSLYT
jgi:hypothetical protein